MLALSRKFPRSTIFSVDKTHQGKPRSKQRRIRGMTSSAFVYIRAIKYTHSRYYPTIRKGGLSWFSGIARNSTERSTIIPRWATCLSSCSDVMNIWNEAWRLAAKVQVTESVIGELLNMWKIAATSTLTSGKVCKHGFISFVWYMGGVHKSSLLASDHRSGLLQGTNMTKQYQADFP